MFRSIFVRSALVALLTSALFLAVGWTTRFPYHFPDLNNYREGFESGWYVFSILNLDWLSFVISEGAWVNGFDWLWRQTGNIDTSFFLVTAISLFLIVRYIYLRTQSIIACLFIFNPAFINLVVEQLRSGLASALFLSGVMVRSRVLKAILFLLSLSIHTAFILFVVFYYLIAFSERFNVMKLFNKRPVILLTGFAAFAALVTYLRDFALSSVGDERAYIVEDQTSGVYLAVGWLMFLGTYGFLRDREKSFAFDVYFFTLNIFMFIASIYFGSYGARFVAIAIPSLAAMSGHLEPRLRLWFFAHYFLFSAVYFAFWLGR